ncbi:MAG: GntR family transcriptional regulator [Xanthobacteraceae bacterium]|nr:GntR family transcriptional regulator [Xanthobacteraceae bacterium]
MKRKSAKTAAGSKARGQQKRRGNGVDLQLSNATPIYVQLIVHFRHQIETGKWRQHQIIPPLHELAAEFGVTRATVRQAIGFLHREGLLSSRRGRGTEVIGKPHETLWQPVPNTWSDLVKDSDRIEGDVLELARPGRLPEVPQTERGELAPSYHVVRRLLRRGGIPYLVGISYVDRRVVDEVGADIFKTSSLYRVIETSRHFHAVRGDQLISVGTADAELAFLLGIPLSSPIVNVSRWIFNEHDTLIYQSEGQFRSDFVQAARRLR